ncbi:MAG: histidine kinase dimerization/phospho-acceptor domain-containing protein [Pleurocapsa sp.]
MPISNTAYLKNFVYPIPICQQGTDLGSILKIFQHLNCKLLAVPQNCGGWGIIQAEDLLSLIAKNWLADKTALVSHPRSEAYQRSIPYVKTSDFDSIIKPALICQADIQLDEFLNYLHYESLFEDQDEYLVVNAAGELQGKLDRNKILKYLARQSSTNTPHLPASLNYLNELIDFIALPLKIETVAGKDIYLNKCWQELITDNQDSQQPLEQPKTKIATWWMEQQLYSPQQDCQQQCQAPKIPELANGDRAKSNCHTLSLSEISPKILNSEYTAFTPDSSVEQQEQLDYSPLGVVSEQVSDWNYLKIPFVAQKQLAEITDSPYRLVIATKIAVKKPFNPSSISESKTLTTLSNRLLATIGHELKSPLTGIIGLSSLLKEQKLGQLNQRQARYVKLIQSSGQKMMGIADDLLRLTSLVNHQLLEPELINLEFLCRQLYQQALNKVALASADSLFETKASGLKLDIEIESGEIAIADKLFLSCILSHLILATIKIAKSPNNFQIKIRSLQKMTAIVVSSDLSDRSSASENGSSGSDSDLDLVIAEYLAEVIYGSVTSLCLSNRCQFTLLLPQDSTQQELSGNSIINPANLTKTTNQNLTILCLYPELEVIDPQANHCSDANFDLKSWSDNSEKQANARHRIIEADSLDQAHILARIWQLDVIILDGYQIIEPTQYLRSLQESEYLAALPLITLDAKTTEAANQIEGLNVYPCLLPAEHRSVANLMQVIQIATGV